MFNKIILVSFILIMVLSCKTAVSNDAKEMDFDQYFLKSQDLSNRGKYQKAIDVLVEIQEKFPNIEVLSVSYNMGFNYYNLKNITKAKQYLNQVITVFETNTFSEAYIQENRKFVVLSGIILDKIEKNKEELKDPYHIKEELAKNKTLKPKKNIKPKVIRDQNPNQNH